MALAHWQSTFTDEFGNIRPNIEVTIRDESNGAIAAIYDDIDGTTSKPNPFTTDEFGYGHFYAAPGEYRIQAEAVDWRNVPVLSSAALNQAVTDAEAARDEAQDTADALALTQSEVVRLNRSVQRLGDVDQTFHADFSRDAYGRGDLFSVGLNDALAASYFNNIRATAKWTWQPTGPDGAMELTENAADTIAPEWEPFTGEPLGHLNEPASTNEIPNGNDFTVNPSRINLPGGADSFPGGRTGSTAERLIPDTSDGSHYVRQPNNLPGDAGTFQSYYLHIKPQGYSQFQIRVNGFGGSIGATYDLNSESVTFEAPDTTYSRIQALPDGWYRCEVGGVIDSGSGGSFVHIFVYDENGDKQYIGDGTSGMDVYWGQLENRTVPTSPIWTTSGPITREGDNLRISADGWQNRRESSVIVEMSILPGGNDDDNVYTIGNGTGGNRLTLSKQGQFYVTTDEGATFSGNSYNPSLYPNSTTYALSYQELGGINVAIDGATNSRNTSAMSDKTLPVSRVTLGTQHHFRGGVIHAYIRYFKYLPKFLNLSELEALS